MNLFRTIEAAARRHPSRLAFHGRLGGITYEALWERSGRLAAFLEKELGEDRRPLCVYGHKEPLMIVSFLACVRSGRAYCPLDTSMAQERLDETAAAVGNRLVLAAAPLTLADKNIQVVDPNMLLACTEYSGRIDPVLENGPDDVHYLIFTSGSTGKPKGVPITTGALQHYLDWYFEAGYAGPKAGMERVLNQAPFSFDLSVMDLYSSLTSGATLWAVDHDLQQDQPALLDYLKEGRLDHWVSTPSFAEMCLADPSFRGENFPEMDTFLFCGETLPVGTAARLLDRFPRARVINTYGPTESTVCVTSVPITKAMTRSGKDLPIGVPKPGSEILIRTEDAAGTVRYTKEPGVRGEMVILGDTLSQGYFHEPEKTKKAFGPVEWKGKTQIGYRTGDGGRYETDGLLYCDGRLDSQIKYHGYRIELGDIEANLLRQDDIASACCVPMREGGIVKGICAFLVRKDSMTPDSYEARKAVKTELRALLPRYMVPKKICFLPSLPMNGNGKTDRRALEAML